MIGRVSEIQELRRAYASEESEFVAVYGRRRIGEPIFRLVQTGTPFAYTRPDGVIVCPLGCLRP